MKDEPMTAADNPNDALIRLQERYRAQEDQLQRLERMIESGQRANTDALEKLATAFNNAFQKAAADYVTKKEFQDVKNIVYGAVGLILLAFMGGLVALTFQQ